MYLIPAHNLVIAADTPNEAVTYAINFLLKTKRVTIGDDGLNFEIIPLTPYDTHIAYVAEETDASQPQH